MKKNKGLVRGTPSAVFLSAVIHGLILLVAGGLVVFTIIEKQEAKFVPHKIDRPKMQLKKLRVKIKEQAKPRKTTQRIASARKTSDLPDIQLPEMAGMGAGLEGTIGGFDMMADLSEMTLFGGGRSMGNDLEGTSYDLKRDSSGNPIPGMTPGLGGTPMQFDKTIDEFLSNNWSPQIFSPYYKAPTKLYATHLMIPPVASALGPSMFGIKDNIEAALWAIHYKGKSHTNRAGHSASGD